MPKPEFIRETQKNRFIEKRRRSQEGNLQRNLKRPGGKVSKNQQVHPNKLFWKRGQLAFQRTRSDLQKCS